MRLVGLDGKLPLTATLKISLTEFAVCFSLLVAGRAGMIFAELSQAVRSRYLLHTSGVFWRVVDVADGWGG
jgi:hypothetical protein